MGQERTFLVLVRALASLGSMPPTCFQSQPSSACCCILRAYLVVEGGPANVCERGKLSPRASVVGHRDIKFDALYNRANWIRNLCLPSAGRLAAAHILDPQWSRGCAGFCGRCFQVGPLTALFSRDQLLSLVLVEVDGDRRSVRLWYLFRTNSTPLLSQMHLPIGAFSA